MTLLIIGIILFLSVHTFTTMREARQGAINSLGEGGYKFVYSVLSLIGLAIIVYGYGAYRAAGYQPVWAPPRWMAHIAMLLMLFAFVFLAAAYAPLGKIKATLKHPMLVAIKTWSLAHLLANGDLGSIILFGSFLAWAVYDRIAVKRRGAPSPVVMSTSFTTGDAISIVGGVLAYGLMLWLHPMLIGVPVLSR